MTPSLPPIRRTRGTRHAAGAPGRARTADLRGRSCPWRPAGTAGDNAEARTSRAASRCIGLRTTSRCARPIGRESQAGVRSSGQHKGVSTAQNNGETAARVGRPFPKGVSGNPGGRPKGLARYVRELVGDDGRRIADFMLSVLERLDSPTPVTGSLESLRLSLRSMTQEQKARVRADLAERVETLDDLDAELLLTTWELWARPADVEKVGLRGEVDDVARGYARNFLVPRKLVTTPNRRLHRVADQRPAPPRVLRSRGARQRLARAGARGRSQA